MGFLDNYWKNMGKRKGGKFVKNLFKKDKELQRLSREAEKLQDKVVAKLQGLDEPDYDKLAKDLEDYV
ncbi:MAG: hypothetical protein HOL09_08000 [Candidatus Marinimicrobia bacterium]|jgi:hypothetical protein|nr:hypothetical protein [Candidatus Neomarinimicrobiota bacterium]MBT3764004.1 hypothetical protein [Candidatus Neomarinimicrobiota bacterium]MBT4053887.1 hypothetical protein [Candidatus Neomarinimicrobiota bacterium]MBT4635731.1 hypothetical protein [Candidatus Neomarinimicrobiota bacterium]MBT5386827.1 hypothetical protein [Candidatus Neomarinimicrobiota bacterium]